MYTDIEIRQLINKGHVLTSIERFLNGYLAIQHRHTINYYAKKSDGLWYNYNCRTIY